jgi:Domain of unknown function (DUF5642)
VNRQPQQLIACVLTVLAAAMLPGCARSVDGTPVSPPDAAAFPSWAPKTKSAPPPRTTYYDISRLSQLEGQFPPGFDRVQNTTIAPLGTDADKFFAVGVGDIVKVDPPLCRSVLQPVRPPQDAQYTMIGGLGQGAILVATVTRQSGPPIDGIVTTESIAVANQGGTKSYVFAAFLSETVAVAAEGVLPGNSDAEDLLSGMLVKAVNVIRAA